MPLKAQLVYTWTIPFLDDFGCYTADPEDIKTEVFPNNKRISVAGIRDSLLELQKVGLIILYSVNGKVYQEYNGFDNFQTFKSDRAKKREYPALNEGLEDNGNQMIPMSALSEVNLSKVNLIKEKVSKRKFIPPTLQEVIKYVKEKCYQVDVKKFLEYYTESNWHDRDGKPVRNWKQKIIAVWNKPGGPKKCRSANCKELGVYTSTDDTGQVCWWCEDHKQGWKPTLTKELTENTLKIVPGVKQSLSDKRNEQKNKLGVR